MSAAQTVPLGGWLDTKPSIFPAFVWKEIRALLPFWLLTLIIPPVFVLSAKVPLLPWIGGCLYVMGCVTVACQTFGQELGAPSAAMLLAQPISRRRLWGIKMGVLAVALASVATVMVMATVVLLRVELWPMLSGQPAQNIRGEVFALWALILLVPICAFCTTPWLTLLLRQAIGAEVFALAIPLGLWGIVNYIEMRLSLTGLAADFFIFGVFGAVMIVYCAAGISLAYRHFLRWEALEGGGGNLALAVRWPAGLTRMIGSTLHRRPLLQLAVKELRIQHWSLMTAGLFFAGWLVLIVAQWAKADLSPEWFVGIPFVGGAIVALLAGTLSCAEERQFGTLEWQLTLAVPVWKQWLFKVAAALGIALALGALLPVLQLVAASQFGFIPFKKDYENLFIPPLIMVSISILGIYASSISKTSLRALALAILIIVLAFWVIVALPYMVFALIGSPEDGVRGLRGLGPLMPRWMLHPSLALWMTILALFLLTWLAFAFVNFRRIDLRSARHWKQLAAAAVIFGTIYLTLSLRMFVQ